MKLVSTTIICFLLLSLGDVLINKLIGQTTKPIQFNTIQKTEGLPNNTINKIIKDKLGFIWIATNDGLCRYDGPNQIEVFKANKKTNENGLESSYIRTLFIDSKDNLWIGTRLGGLTRYHQSSGTWTTFRHDKENPTSISNDEILTILEDSQHRLWVGTEYGLNLYNYETETFTNFLPDSKQPYQLKTKAVLDIIEDDKGWIWVGTWEGGLHLLLAEAEETVTKGKFRNIIPSTNKAASNVWKIYQDKQKRYWLGTHGGGLFLMNLPSSASNKFSEQNWQPKFYNYQEDAQDNTSISNNAVQDILQDKKGDLWITTVHGLSKLDKSYLLATDFSGQDKPVLKFHSYYFEPKNAASIAGNDITSILEDDQGLLWLSTTTGISQYNWFTSQFDVFNIFNQIYKTPNSQNFFIVNPQTAWVGVGENGILEYDFKTQALSSFSNQHPDIYIGNYVSCIYSPDKEWLYVGSKLGVSKFNIHTFETVKFPAPNWIKNNINDFHIQSVMVDQSQTIWISTKVGLYAINQQTGTYTSYARDSNRPNATVNDNAVNAILEDKEGNLWVATFSGLSKATKTKDGTLKFQHFFHQVDNPNSLIANQITALKLIDDELYIGTTTGLCSYNLTTGLFEDYTTEGHKYWIQSIIDVKDGNLWASTTEGLFFLDTKRKYFNVFEKKDGLGDLNFRQGSAARDEKDFIYFGSRAGITRFHSDRIIGNKQAPPVHITNLRTVSQQGETIYNGIYKKDLVLNHNDYQLSINFAALNYNRGEKNEYIYKLEGFEDKWQSSKFGNPVVYTNLAPKTYTFRVKAANNDGVWNETGTSIKIIKKPAFWQTWWFYLLCALSLGALIGLGIKLYTQNIRSRNLTLQSYNSKLNKEIENRNRIEKALANRERFLRLIMDSVPQYIFWVDTKFRFQGANKNLLKLLNLPSEKEVLNKRAIELNLPKAHIDAQEKLMEEVLTTKKPIFNYIYETPDLPNFPKLWLEHNFMPLKNETGKIMGVLISATNISKRIESEHLAQAHTKQLQEFNKELKRSNKDLEQFAYIASHDLKEPLRIIGNFSGLLARSYKTELDEDAFQYINFIEDGVRRMSNLINSLLTYSRVGRKETKFRNIDLNKLVEFKLFDLSKVIEERNAEVIVDTLPTIYGEREQIGMVFYNLINNAIKFNKQAKPIVSIKMEEAASQDCWQFAVADNGIGIDPRYQDQIFEIFRRLHGKKDYEGTGIGLSVCQKIVFRHEGKIWLDSTLGKGTTFHFTISKKLATKQFGEAQKSKELSSAAV